MNLSIKEHHFPDHNFPVSGGFQFLSKWEGVRFELQCRDQDSYQRFSFWNEDNRCVALLELDWGNVENRFAGSDYKVPTTNNGLLEIQFIDVHQGFRNNGVGTQIIDWLIRKFPECDLCALEEEAAGFWQRLGWEQILPSEKRMREMYFKRAAIKT